MKSRTLFPTSRLFAARMNRRALPLMMGLLSLQLGCGGNEGGDGPTGPPRVLQPSELCSDNSKHDIPTFEDAKLEQAVRDKLSVGAQEDLTCGLLSGILELGAAGNSIPEGIQNLTSLVGIQNLMSLKELRLGSSDITDISALSGLASLTFLELGGGSSITDISALSGLTSLTMLYFGGGFGGGSISDYSPLSGLTSLTDLRFSGNSMTDLGVLSRLTSLTELHVHGDLITDISGLSGLTKLVILHLDAGGNGLLTDISPLSGLTSLTRVLLDHHPNLADIQPLLDNPGIGPGDTVGLINTKVSCADIARLQARGVGVNMSGAPHNPICP